MVDDVVNCRTENVEMCKPVTTGFITEDKCELWPQERCEVTQQTVKKYSPKVQCKKVAREICTAGCLVVQVTLLEILISFFTLNIFRLTQCVQRR